MLKRASLRRPFVLESDSEKHHRIAATKALIAAIAREHLTRDEASKIFKELARRPTRTRNWDMERLINETIDAEPDAPATVLGERLYEKYKQRVGQSPDAIAQHIRRLRKERKKLRAFINRKRTRTFLGPI